MDHHRGGAPARGPSRGRSRSRPVLARAASYAWVPVPVFLVLFVALRPFDAGSFEPPLLLSACNLVFATTISLLVAWMAGSSYLTVGSNALLFVAWGSLAFGVGNAVSALAALYTRDPDHVATGHDLSALAAGLCYLVSVLLSARPDWQRPRRGLFAGGIVVAGLALFAVAMAKAYGWGGLAFFTESGPTPLRQVVLASAVLMFLFGGTLFWALHGRTTPFVTWYSLALLLVGVGLLGILVESRPGSPGSWAGRGAQYLGCAYLFVALTSGRSNTFPLVHLLHETHDRYRRLVEMSPDAIVVHAEGVYVFANPAAARLHGALSPEAIVGKEVLDLVHPDFRPDIRDRIEIVNSGGWTPLRETTVLRLDGGSVPVETTAAPVEFEGRPAIQVVMRDITERHRAEQKIREATLEAERRASEAAEGKRILNEQAVRLEEANRLKDEFLATLSHELRTPVTAILGWSHMLVRGMLDPDASRRAIEAIHRNAEVQVALINDVLDVSRIVSGKLRLDMKRLDAAGCLKNALNAVRPAAAARQIELAEDGTEPVFVMGDGDRLQQVFWNLLSNAVKFTPPGGRVTMALHELNGEAVIQVSDTGPGIAPEFLPRVFDRFSQADASPARAHGGLGIGLAIVRHLVELHGGRVLAESAGLGQGATFTVSLPAASVPRDAREWLEESEFGRRLVAPQEPKLAGLKVLVVDDEADARDLLATVLRSYGAEVQAASSAPEALSVVEAWRPDVLLSDIAMPGGDGYELGRRLRSLPPEAGGLTPAIAVTAYGRPQDRAEALTAGYQEHVPKPVVPLELAAMVEMLARGRTRV